MKISKIITAPVSNKQNSSNNVTRPENNTNPQQKEVSFLSGISFKGYQITQDSYDAHISTSGAHYYCPEHNLLQTVIDNHNNCYSRCNSKRTIYYSDIDEDTSNINADVIVKYKDEDPQLHGYKWIKDSVIYAKNNYQSGNYLDINYDTNIYYMSLWIDAMNKQQSKLNEKANNTNSDTGKILNEITNDSYKKKIGILSEKKQQFEALNYHIHRIEDCINMHVDYERTLYFMKQQEANIEEYKAKIAPLQKRIIDEDKIYENKLKQENEKLNNAQADDKNEIKINIKNIEAEQERYEKTKLSNVRSELAYWQRKLATEEENHNKSIEFKNKAEQSDDFKYTDAIIDDNLNKMEQLYKVHFPGCMN